MMVDLFTRILEIAEENRNAIDHMRDAGHEAAARDRDYKRIRAERMLELRASGMAAGMVEKVAEGDDDVSNAKFAADCADADMASDRELVQNNKKVMDTLRSQMEFERVARQEAEFYEYQ